MSPITRRTARLAAFAFVLIACTPGADRAGDPDTASDTAAAGAESLLRTSATGYRADTTGGELAVSIPVTVWNQTADSLFLQTCGANFPSYLLERLEDGEYVVALRPVCPMIATPPIVVAPGASRTDTLRIRAASADNASAPTSAPTFEGASVDGSYRIVYELFGRGWDASGTPDPAARLSADARSSNRFTMSP